MVLLTHITTHVKTDRYQTLLSEMGFNAFPSVAVLDAEGRFIDGHMGGDELAGLTKMVRDAQAYAKDVIAKADAGDATARKQFFLHRVEHAAIGLDEAHRGLETIPGFTKEERETVAGKLPTLEMNLIMTAAWQDRTAAANKVAAMFKGGRIPAAPADARRLLSTVITAAEADKDVQLFKDALARFKTVAGDDKAGARQVEALEKRLKALEDAGKSGDAKGTGTASGG